VNQFFPILKIFPAYGTRYFSPVIFPDVADFLYSFVFFISLPDENGKVHSESFHDLLIPDVFSGF
jgi:hypothetical protein